MKEYGKYIARESIKLKSLPRGAKAWWSKSRRLKQRKGIVSSVPALKDPDNHWILHAKEKADLFAHTFLKKCALSAEVCNEYTHIPQSTFRAQTKIKSLTEKNAQEVMDNLRIDSGTGPDLLPARILKNCAEALAKPVWLLTMCILMTGVWPQLWRQHWITRLYRKKCLRPREL